MAEELAPTTSRYLSPVPFAISVTAIGLILLSVYAVIVVESVLLSYVLASRARGPWRLATFISTLTILALAVAFVLISTDWAAGR